VSVAVQVTAVVPAEKADPDAGEHDVVTGAVPPDVVGAVQLTTTGWFARDKPDCAAGHVIDNAGPTGGGVGVVVVPSLQPVSRIGNPRRRSGAHRACVRGILMILAQGFHALQAAQ
jgi:hypothetical protein